MGRSFHHDLHVGSAVCSFLARSTPMLIQANEFNTNPVALKDGRDSRRLTCDGGNDCACLRLEQKRRGSYITTICSAYSQSQCGSTRGKTRCGKAMSLSTGEGGSGERGKPYQPHSEMALPIIPGLALQHCRIALSIPVPFGCWVSGAWEALLGRPRSQLCKKLAGILWA